MSRRTRYGSSGATVEDLYAHRGKVQRYKLIVPPAHGYGRYVAYFATKKHAYQTAQNLRSAGYRPKIVPMALEPASTARDDRNWLRVRRQKASIRNR
jgi:hypothetical protein